MFVIEELRKNNAFKQVRVPSTKDLFSRVGLRSGSGATTSSDPDKCPVIGLNQRKLDAIANAEYLDTLAMENESIMAEMAQSESESEPANEQTE